MALASDSSLAFSEPRSTLRLPVADLVVLFGIVVFGTNILEVTLRDGPLERFVGLVYMACYAAGLLFASSRGPCRGR